MNTESQILSTHHISKDTDPHEHTLWCAERDVRDDAGQHYCVRAWRAGEGTAEAAVELSLHGGALVMQAWVNDTGGLDAVTARRLADALVEAAAIMEAG